jgi:hypothetical protein
MAPDYRYTDKDRRRQLRQLAERLPALIAFLRSVPELAARAPVYEAALALTLRLQKEGFGREELVALSDAVPDVFQRYRDWEPPAVRLPDGRVVDVPWYAPLQEVLQPVLDAAGWLRGIGWRT